MEKFALIFIAYVFILTSESAGSYQYKVCSWEEPKNCVYVPYFTLKTGKIMMHRKKSIYQLTTKQH